MTPWNLIRIPNCPLQQRQVLEGGRRKFAADDTRRLPHHLPVLAGWSRCLALRWWTGGCFCFTLGRRSATSLPSDPHYKEGPRPERIALAGGVCRACRPSPSSLWIRTDKGNSNYCHRKREVVIVSFWGGSVCRELFKSYDDYNFVKGRTRKFVCGPLKASWTLNNTIFPANIISGIFQFSWNVCIHDRT